MPRAPSSDLRVTGRVGERLLPPTWAGRPAFCSVLPRGHEPGSGGRAGKCSAHADGAWRLRPVGSTCGRAQLGQEGAGVPGGAATFSAAAAKSDGF